MEHLVLVGTNHRLAPVEWRERLAFGADTLSPALQTLHRQFPEVVLLSTCNRTEIYALATQPESTEKQLYDFFQARAGSAQISFYVRRDREVIGHLLSVACGLDSMLLGEFEIQRQVRMAYEAAAEQATAGPILSALFQSAIHMGKRARTETAIGRGAASTAYAAVQLARQKLGTLAGRYVLVIGAGEMGQRVAKNLRGERISAIIVANRTYDRAVAIAHDLGGRAIHFDRLAEGLAAADVVISATGAPHLVLDAAAIRQAMARRPERPLCIIDIAVPRDVDSSAKSITNVHLFDLDAAQAVAQENLAERQKQVALVHEMIAVEVEKFWDWYTTRRVAPVIAALCERAEVIRRAELERTQRRLGHLGQNDLAAIDALTHSIVNRILAPPIVHLKEQTRGEANQSLIATLCELFDLEPETRA